MNPFKKRCLIFQSFLQLIVLETGNQIIPTDTNNMSSNKISPRVFTISQSAINEEDFN